MPRVAGVSGTSRTRPILLRPSPVSVARWLLSRRVGLPVCLTRMSLVTTLFTFLRGREVNRLEKGRPLTENSCLASTGVDYIALGQWNRAAKVGSRCGLLFRLA